MAKVASIFNGFLVAAGLVIIMAPVAHAQTYVYPISTYGTSYANTYNSTSCVVVTNYLSVGSSDLFTGNQVSQLQQYLNRAGYLSGVSGYFDTNTYNAVIAFQSAHGISPTGTVGPVTRAAIQQASCGYNYVNPVPTPIIVPTYPSSNNCYSRYNPYNYGYGNCYNYTNAITLNSANASYSYNTITLTLNGYGFTSNNTVHFDGSTYTAYSSNGTTLSFTIPYAYYTGNYDIYVVNSNGASSNTLSFPLTSSSYNSYTNGSISLSSINGPTSVQAGSSNSWSVMVNNGGTSYWYSNNSTTVSVNWGDNTSSNSQNIYVSGSQNLSFNHVYANAGTYTMRITANGTNGSYYYQTLTVTVYGNSNYYGNPYISYVSPNPASVGTTVTISGSGFSSYGNTVHFGNGGSMNVSSYNGSTIYYTIPSQVSGCDLTTGGYCAQWMQYVSSGSYPVYITNSSGQSSNTVYITVR